MRLEKFQGEEVEYISSNVVTDGVWCDVYVFKGNNKKDLGVVTVKPGFTTPRQKVLLGEKTLEVYISGSGNLKVIKPNGACEVHKFPESFLSEVEVSIGDVMSWQAGVEDLVFAEVCFPPYEDGRFQNVVSVDT